MFEWLPVILIVVLVLLVVLTAFDLFGRGRTTNAGIPWETRAKAATNELASIAIEECTCRSTNSADQLEWAQSYLASRQDTIEVARKLLQEESARTASDPRLFHELSDNYNRVMHDARAILRSTVPDLRRLLSASPVQASTIAAGGLTLTGMIWAAGYFSVLGVPVLPLLRDAKDLVLIGISAGFVPIAIFAVLAVVLMRHVLTVTLTGNRQMASVNDMQRALATGRLLRSPHHWWPLTAIGFVAVFVLSVGAGLAVRSNHLGGPPSRLSIIGMYKKDEVVTRCGQLVGGLGAYAVIRDASGHEPCDADGNGTGTESGSQNSHSVKFRIVPANQITAVVTAGPPQEPPPPDLPAVRNAAWPAPIVVPVVMREQPWWQYATGVAQCEVVHDSSDARNADTPLLFPFFADNKENLVDLSYYDHHPENWPVDGAAGWDAVKASGNTAADRNSFATRTAASKMAEDIGRLVASSKPVRSIYFIGFASQTNNPDHNQILARNRADFVRTLVQLHRAVKALDVDMRVIGVGEMPDVPWAGRQGDVSRRTVLVAVCRRDI